MSHWGFVFLLQVHKIKVCVSLGVCFLVTGALDKGVSFMQDADEIDGGPPVRPETFRQIPSISDTVICYPTQQGRQRMTH